MGRHLQGSRLGLVFAAGLALGCGSDEPRSSADKRALRKAAKRHEEAFRKHVTSAMPGTLFTYDSAEWSCTYAPRMRCRPHHRKGQVRCDVNGVARAVRVGPDRELLFDLTFDGPDWSCSQASVTDGFTNLFRANLRGDDACALVADLCAGSPPDDPSAAETWEAALARARPLHRGELLAKQREKQEAKRAQLADVNEAFAAFAKREYPGTSFRRDGADWSCVFGEPIECRSREKCDLWGVGRAARDGKDDVILFSAMFTPPTWQRSEVQAFNGYEHWIGDGTLPEDAAWFAMDTYCRGGPSAATAPGQSGP